jgi:hypothetical protein
VSAFSLDEYKPDEKSIKPLKGIYPNFNSTPFMPDGTRTTKNFDRHSIKGTFPNPLSRKNFISPVSIDEKTGPRWGY